MNALPFFAVVFILSPIASASHWTFGPSLVTPRANCGVAVAPDCKIYAVGGRISWTPNGSNGTASDTVEVLDANGDLPQWTIMPSAMMTRREGHSTVCVNGHLYAIGGANSFDNGTVFYNSVERLDLLDLAAGWAQIQNMPTPRSDAATIVDDYGRIYVIGGTNGPDIVLSTVERYDAVRNEWETLPPLSMARNNPGAAKDSKGRLYVIGGGINLGNVATVEMFDPSDPENGWVARSPIPAELQLSQSAAVVTGSDGRFYLAGGATAQGPVLDRCIRYDPELDHWQAWVSMPEPRYVHSNPFVTDCNGRMWLIGSYTAPVPESIVLVLNGACGSTLARPLLMDSNADAQINGVDVSATAQSKGSCP